MPDLQCQIFFWRERREDLQILPNFTWSELPSSNWKVSNVWTSCQKNFEKFLGKMQVGMGMNYSFIFCFSSWFLTEPQTKPWTNTNQVPGGWFKTRLVCINSWPLISAPRCFLRESRVLIGSEPFKAPAFLCRKQGFKPLLFALYEPPQHSWKFVAAVQFRNIPSRITNQQKSVTNVRSWASLCPPLDIIWGNSWKLIWECYMFKF